MAEYDARTLPRRWFSNWTYLEYRKKMHWIFSRFPKVILLGLVRRTTNRKGCLDLLHNNFTQNFTLLAADISSSVSSPPPKRKCLPHLPVFRHGIFRLSFFCLPSLSLMSSSFLGFWPFLPWTMSPNSISFASLEV